MKVLDLLEEIEEICDTASGVPLTNKIMVDKAELIEIVSDIRKALPDEIQQAQFIKDERERILGDAKEEYETIIKDAEQRAAELLDSVGIHGAKHKRYPANLSGGEQQRVAIARSLSSGAKVILADEPTGNLDKANGKAVISILRRLAHERGYCVVVVTHNLDIAEESDVVFRMSDGELGEYRVSV